MTHRRNIIIVTFLLSAIIAKAQEITGQSVLQIADRVFNYQQEHPTNKPFWEWEYGAYYSGVFDLYRVNPEIKYLKGMVDMGEDYKWAIRPRPYDANV